MQNDPRRTKRTALITGASSGIGYELAKCFGRGGFNLVLVARAELRLAKIAFELDRSCKITVTVMPKDLSKPASAQELYLELKGKGIEVDILVNNAGFNVYGPFSETDPEKEFEMMQVNMISLTQLTKLFLPAMLERRFGKILNLASTAAFSPGPGDAVYCATKAYVLSFSEALAEELRGTGVTVTTLCPGPTKTEFAERADMTDAKIFQGRLSSADEVAQAGYEALMRGRANVIVGLANKLLILSIRFSPRTLVTRIAKTLLGRARQTARATVSQSN
jgi:uncharacterized protein